MARDTRADLERRIRRLDRRYTLTPIAVVVTTVVIIGLIFWGLR
jgi:hypothetical protein